MKTSLAFPYSGRAMSGAPHSCTQMNADDAAWIKYVLIITPRSVVKQRNVCFQWPTCFFFQGEALSNQLPVTLRLQRIHLKVWTEQTKRSDVTVCHHNVITPAVTCRANMSPFIFAAVLHFLMLNVPALSSGFLHSMLLLALTLTLIILWIGVTASKGVRLTSNPYFLLSQHLITEEKTNDFSLHTKHWPTSTDCKGVKLSSLVFHLQLEVEENKSVVLFPHKMYLNLLLLTIWFDLFLFTMSEYALDSWFRSYHETNHTRQAHALKYWQRNSLMNRND